MDCLNISSSCSSDSSEGCLNVECSNNLLDVPFEENEGSVMDYDEDDAGSLTVNSVDMQDFLEGNEEEETTSISVSSLLDSVSDTGALNVKEEVIVDDADDEAMVDVDQVSISQSDVVTRSELSAIEAADARFEADAAVLDHMRLLEAAELTRISEQVLPQSPVSETSTDTSIHLTPLQEYKLKVRNDAIREERREAEEIQAFLDEQELSVTQCTGYGVRQGPSVFNRLIEGLLPKIPSIQLTHNWLTNSENNFNIFI